MIIADRLVGVLTEIRDLLIEVRDDVRYVRWEVQSQCLDEEEQCEADDVTDTPESEEWEPKE